MRFTSLPMTIFATIVFLALAAGATAGGGVSPIHESFSGNGEYAGLDNPAWESTVWPPVIADESIAFDIQSVSEDEALGILQILTEGTGSFEAIYQLDDLVLSGARFPGPAERYAHVELFYGYGGGVSGRLVSDDDEGVVTWALATRDSSGKFEVFSVKEGSDVSLIARYVSESNEFFFGYDNDFTDDIPPFFAEPLSFRQETIKPDDRYLGLHLVSGDTGRVAVKVDEFTLTPFSEVFGDYDGDGMLGAGDIDRLYLETHAENPSLTFDINEDEIVDQSDVALWIHDVKQTFFGDANLDGEFASSDLVNVFTAGEYEDDIELNSNWETGDWNGDRDLTTSDLVLAFQDGGYEQGPRVAQSVPEPNSLAGVMLGFLWLAIVQHRGVLGVHAILVNLRPIHSLRM